MVEEYKHEGDAWTMKESQKCAAAGERLSLHMLQVYRVGRGSGHVLCRGREKGEKLEVLLLQVVVVGSAGESHERAYAPCHGAVQGACQARAFRQRRRQRGVLLPGRRACCGRQAARVAQKKAYACRCVW